TKAVTEPGEVGEPRLGPRSCFGGEEALPWAVADFIRLIVLGLKQDRIGLKAWDMLGNSVEKDEHRHGKDRRQRTPQPNEDRERQKYGEGADGYTARD